MIDSYLGLVEEMYSVGAWNLFLSISPVEKLTKEPLNHAQLKPTGLWALITDFCRYDTQIAFNRIIASPTAYAYGYAGASRFYHVGTFIWKATIILQS